MTFEEWLHSTECPIPAGTPMNSHIVMTCQVAYAAGRAAALEDEPVAWRLDVIPDNIITHRPLGHPERWTPLYTSPPAPKEPTYEQGYVQGFEAGIREKP